MTEDLDTLLTALCVEIDDHVAPPRQGRGRRPRLTDAELVCLAVARVSPSWCDSLRVIDATPLPCGASRETVNRSDIGGTGGYGFCASHTRYYWGLKHLSGHRARRNALHLVLGGPEAGRAGGLPGPADHRRRDRAGCPRRHGAGRQGLGRAR